MRGRSMAWRGVASQTEGLFWSLRRALRRSSRWLGPAGWLLLLIAAGCAVLLVLEARFMLDASRLQAWLRETSGASRSAMAASATGPAAAAETLDGRARLKAFDDHLLPHDDIPSVLQDVLRLAEDQGLATQRGDYRAQADAAGHFLRYRMSLPVRGTAPAVHRFMQQALLAQPTLALESVQFKRDRIESTDIEVRIQWVVYAQLPGLRVPPADVAAAARSAPR